MNKKQLTMLALVGDAFGGRGGIAQYNRDFLTSLPGNGYLSSIIIVPRIAPDPPNVPSGLRQTTAHRSRLVYSVVAIAIAFCRPTDIVFCGHIYMAPLAAIIAKLKNAKLVIQTHGVEAWHRPRKSQRIAVDAADFVLAVSRYTRAELLKWSTVAPERVLVLPNTVREAFSPGESKLRETLGLMGKQVLLSVGRMDPHQRYKGHDLVISTIPDLVNKGHDICYLVIGEGDDRSRLEKLAYEQRVSDRVRFLGFASTQNIVELYRAADLFVLPSTGEGFGISFIEAMACGTRALGLSAAGSTDALADGNLGSITSRDQLSNSISFLLGSTKPDPNELAAATNSRFGRHQFVRNVRGAFKRFAEAE